MRGRISGADVDQLEALAKQFHARATRLREVVVSSSALITMAAWTGPSVERLRRDWHQSARPALISLAETLDRNAGELRREAHQQRVASGVTLSPRVLHSVTDYEQIRHVLSNQPDLSSGEVEEIVNALRQGIGGALLGAKFGTAILDVGAGIELPLLDKILPGVGIAHAAIEFAERSAKRDYFGAFMTFLSGSADGAEWIGRMQLVKDSASAKAGALGSAKGAFSVKAGIAGLAKGSVSAKLASLGPLGLGVTALNTFVDWTLPSTPERQDTTFQKGIENLFGKGVKPSDLSIEQAERVHQRYHGIIGVAHMISDTMDATADRIFPWNK